MHFQVYELSAALSVLSLLVYLGAFVWVVLARWDLRTGLTVGAVVLLLTVPLFAETYVTHPCNGLTGWAYWLSGCFLVR